MPADSIRFDVASIDPLPLQGATVAVTRAAEQAGPLVDRLVALGADVVEIPIIAIVDPADGGAALSTAITHLATYDWVVLTSPNAARRFVEAVDAAGVRAYVSKVAAVGPGTASVLAAAGHSVELVPRRAIGEGLVEAFANGPGRVLLPRAAVARDVVPDGLRAKGWEVEVLEAYRTVPVAPDDADLSRLGAADLVCFTSSSTVDALVKAAGLVRLPGIVVSMGVATTATAMSHGVAVNATAEPSTLDGLLDAIIRAWRTAGTNYPLRP